MKPIFVVWSIPDYIGIDIEFIFDNEEAAKRCVDDHNATAPMYDQWSYDEYSVFTAFKKGEEYGKEKTHD